MSHRILVRLAVFLFPIASAACIVGEPIDDEIDETERVGQEEQAIGELDKVTVGLGEGKACKCRADCRKASEECYKNAVTQAAKEACITARHRKPVNH